MIAITLDPARSVATSGCKFCCLAHSLVASAVTVLSLRSVTPVSFPSGGARPAGRMKLENEPEGTKGEDRRRPEGEGVRGPFIRPHPGPRGPSLHSSPSGLVSSAGPFVPHSLHARLVTSSLGAETAPRVMVEGE